MGLIERALTLVFGGGGSMLRQTAEVFRENAESGAQRDHERAVAALAQFGAEFAGRRSLFDTVIDAINRLPRPMLALGTIGLFVSAMTDPAWFGARMQGLALVPEALWWLMGAVVSFYFGARHQLKGQQFQRDLASAMMRAAPGGAATQDDRTLAPDMQDTTIEADGRNPALEAWRRDHPALADGR